MYLDPYALMHVLALYIIYIVMFMVKWAFKRRTPLSFTCPLRWRYRKR